MKQLLFRFVLILLPQAAQAGSVGVIPSRKPIPNRYIAQFISDSGIRARSAADLMARTHAIRVTAVYENTIQGIAFEGPPAVAKVLAANPIVEFVEEDGLVEIATSQTNLGATWNGISYYWPAGVASLWYLDRIDQASPSFARYNDIFDYCTTGSGTRVYVVDTGIQDNHPEVNGKVDGPASDHWVAHRNANGVTLFEECWSRSLHDPAASHGMAVASLIAGQKFGVAKGATLIDVRTMDCQGEAAQSTITMALDWIPIDPYRGSKSVVNLSFSKLGVSGPYSITRNAVNSLVDTYNIKVVVAAGNANDDSFWYTPASAARAITVGASTVADARWQYSNYRVSLYAPGQYVESAGTRPNGSGYFNRSQESLCADSIRYPQDTCTSGTSFATPLVAGVIARYLQSNPTHDRDQVLSFLQSEAASGNGVSIQDPASTPRLLNMSDCN